MVRIGVIGTGHLGRQHLRLLTEIPLAQVVGFYDSNPAIALTVSEELKVKAFGSANELMNECEALLIATPTVAHYEYAAAAMRLSKHVFIEKPVAATVEEAKKLTALAHEAGIKAQAGHIERFNPAFRAALEVLDSPMFIETHRLAEFNPRGTDVSVVHDLMIHDIDIVLSVVKAPVKRISASGVAVVSDTPDIANARIEFGNGCVANLTSSRISLKKMRKSRFFQRDAYISVDFLKKKTEIVRLKTIAGEPGPLDITIALPNGKGTKQIYFENPKVEEINALKTELESFLVSIVNDEPVAVSIDDGSTAVQVAHEVMEKINLSLNAVV